MSPDSYFERIDEHRYKPTPHASGAWDPAEMHVSPLAGLAVHALDRHLTTRKEESAQPGRAEQPEGAGRTERAGYAARTLAVSRISFDILGRLALDECEIQISTIRPGRTIELDEVTVLISGRPVIRARVWLLASTDTAAVAGGAAAPLPRPETLNSYPLTSFWPGGYIASLDVRPIAPPQPGRTTAWITTGLDLVAGEPVGPLASYVALVDTANGIAVRQPPTAWMFPNVDLTIHPHRQPEGNWTGLDTTVVFGPTGQGVTTTVLHDITGPIGHAEQILTVRPQTS